MYARERRRRRRAAVVALLLAALAVALLVRSSPVPVTPPEGVTAGDAARCAILDRELPRTLAGRAARPVTPPSALTAAWGRPAVTLTCGAPPPERPVSNGELCFAGVGGSCEAAVGWYRDPFDDRLWQTRVRPVLVVRLASATGVADTLLPISQALTRARG